MTNNRSLVVVVIVGMLMLAAIGLNGGQKSDSARRAAAAAEKNTQIVQRNTDRTECIRGISAELDHAFKTLIGQAFNATTRAQLQGVGQKLDTLPLVTDLANHGGTILHDRVRPCPPAPTKEKP